MAACSRMLTSANIPALLDQQKELEDALTTDLDANEDLPESNCDGTQAFGTMRAADSSGILLGCTSVYLPVTIVEGLKGLAQ